MEVTYDKETDVKYVQIKKGVVDHTREETDWLFIDCNKKGEALGVEILDASQHPVNVTTIYDTLIEVSEREIIPTEFLYQKVPHLIQEAPQFNRSVESVS